MKVNLSTFKNQAGFTAIEVLLMLAIAGGFVTAMVDTFKEGKEFKQELNKNVISPLKPPGDQKQAGTMNNNPWLFQADPAKQPQPALPPPEPIRAENNRDDGGPVTPQMCYKQEYEYGHTNPDGTKVRDGTYWKCLSPQMDPAICPHADLMH